MPQDAVGIDACSEEARRRKGWIRGIRHHPLVVLERLDWPVTGSEAEAS